MTTDTTMVTMSEKPVEMARPDPNEMVAYATQIADALNGVIEGQGLFTIINGKKHVRAEQGQAPSGAICGADLGSGKGGQDQICLDRRVGWLLWDACP